MVERRQCGGGGAVGRRAKLGRQRRGLSVEALEARAMLSGSGSGQGSTYAQLHRDIVIAADIYGGEKSAPRILAAGYGFEGIQGVPGFLTENQVPLAIAAGAGVVGELVGLDPAAPLRNISSAAPPIGIQQAGFSDATVTETFLDAMPIEFSHPVLPSTVLPQNFRVHLNTGEVVTPVYVAQNPNYDFNERQTIVAFGYFGNRLPSGDPAAVHPESFEVVASSTPLQFVTPTGLVEGTGLSLSSSNPYDPYNGPTLVGAKLSRLSLAGDYAPVGFPLSVGNHGVEYYGTGRDLYRLRLFTSGGFSPDGVSGFEPQEFARFFQLSAAGPRGSTVTLGAAGVKYRVAGGVLEVMGIADLGTGLAADPGYTYAEDHDNQFDVIIRASSLQAVRALHTVVLPDPRSGTHSPIYNPGGPGTVPVPGDRYTQPSPGQTFPVEFALASPATVSWAAQSLSAYDQADDLAVAFRLRNAASGEWRLTSSSATAASLVESGEWLLVDVPFATNPNDSLAVPVTELRSERRGDSVYTADPRRIAALERAGYVEVGTPFTAYAKPLTGLDPVWSLVSPGGKHVVAASKTEFLLWHKAGYRPQGVAFYTVRFPNADAAAAPTAATHRAERMLVAAAAAPAAAHGTAPDAAGSATGGAALTALRDGADAPIRREAGSPQVPPASTRGMAAIARSAPRAPSARSAGVLPVRLDGGRLGGLGTDR